jgi:hypothetical protein
MLSVPILDLPRLLLSVLLRLTLGGRSRLLLRFGLFVRALLRPRLCFLPVCMLLPGIGRSSNTEKY